MPKKATDLDDIIEAIHRLATLMDQRFEEVNLRFEQVTQRFNEVGRQFENVNHEQRSMRVHLDNIDDRLTGVEHDIYEIYDQLAAPGT